MKSPSPWDLLIQKPDKKQKKIRPRKEPRAGRVKGKDMTALRLRVFERDKYTCQRCGTVVTWESGELAHRRGKRNHGDSEANTEVTCKTCHRLEHQYGPTMTKPCPKKPPASEIQSPTTASVDGGTGL